MTMEQHASLHLPYKPKLEPVLMRRLQEALLTKIQALEWYGTWPCTALQAATILGKTMKLTGGGLCVCECLISSQYECEAHKWAWQQGTERRAVCPVQRSMDLRHIVLLREQIIHSGAAGV